jgi:hypothetical protein
MPAVCVSFERGGECVLRVFCIQRVKYPQASAPRYNYAVIPRVLFRILRTRWRRVVIPVLVQ